MEWVLSPRAWRVYLRHLDWLLVLATAGLVTYGVTMIYFATRGDVAGHPLAYVAQQGQAVAVGVVAAVAVSLLDYEVFRRWKWLFYAVAVGSLGLVLVAGEVVKGARRWIDLGVTSFQPSATALVLLALAFAAFLADRVDELGSRRVTVAVLALVAVPALLIYREPDFGSAVVTVVLALALLYFWGAPWTHFAAVAGAAAAGAVAVLKVLPLVGVTLIHRYQMDRLLVFLNPNRDPTGAGYNIIQSMIAVGAGGLGGRGDQATQTTLDFLPEHHTDFIFAVICEREGFVGAALLLLLYGLFIWRALRIAVAARDMYGSMLAGGIAVTVLFQVFVNVGMTIGIMPVTGIPLPFVSYGGTAMVAFLVFVGLLQAIHLRATVTSSPRGWRGP